MTLTVLFFFVLLYSLTYAGLERWLATGSRNLDVRETEDPEWFGLGIPYHIPIMFLLFFLFVFTPLIDRITVNPLYLLVGVGNLLGGWLSEDLFKQFLDLLAGEGWIKESDWSSKWGYIPIPFTEEAVIPIWYVAYTGIIIVLYSIFYLN